MRIILLSVLKPIPNAASTTGLTPGGLRPGFAFGWKVQDAKGIIARCRYCKRRKSCGCEAHRTTQFSRAAISNGIRFHPLLNEFSEASQTRVIDENYS